MPAESRIDPAVFDAAQFESVRTLISTERLHVHLVELTRQVSALPISARESIQDDAHKIVSQAGMLGLMRLSGRARALEEACAIGVDVTASLLEFREAATDIRRYAIPAIDSIGG